MIIEIEGDLLESDCNVIGHCCNCFHTMGAGIALQIKKKFPLAYDVDAKTPYGDREKMGTNSQIFCNGKFVVNMYAQYQYGYGNHFHLPSFKLCLERMLNDFGAVNKIGLPYMIGCGLAGGNWEETKKVIEEVTNKFERIVYVHKRKN